MSHTLAITSKSTHWKSVFLSAIAIEMKGETQFTPLEEIMTNSEHDIYLFHCFFFSFSFSLDISTLGKNLCFRWEYHLLKHSSIWIFVGGEIFFEAFKLMFDWFVREIPNEENKKSWVSSQPFLFIITFQYRCVEYLYVEKSDSNSFECFHKYQVLLPTNSHNGKQKTNFTN